MTMEIVSWQCYARLWLSTLAPGPKLFGLCPCQPGLLFLAGGPSVLMVRS